MIGFLTGIGIIIILSQLGDFTGYNGQGPNKVRQTIDLLQHLALALFVIYAFFIFVILTLIDLFTLELIGFL